ncbi:uncharacterized protein LOC111340997 [Stylophora pistillata]|uniref:Uncharacterized protein n=1 Tax=Stylophora pistillata TaxID=50429 RepID=A0A2B4RKJ5_STYPI|nr:uncharacterized protein LOC111340997 [Stylophora pistillata]PFX17323.1 hypothetical protein AWC38_SpisGene18356 [Stylophora pistillata]
MLRKMEIFRIEFIMTIVIYLSLTVMSEKFKVFRIRPEGEDAWLDAGDAFVIPPSQCGSTNIVNCHRFRADVKMPSLDPCACVCPRDRATFMFHNGKYECMGNSQVRRSFGFRQPPFVTFDGETVNSPLRMVNDTDSRRLTLSNSLRSCKVDTVNSWSLGCYVPEAPFSNKSPFEVHYGTDFTDNPFFLSVGGNGVFNTAEFKGKIIRLGILCNKLKQSLLFKYEGIINCNGTPPTLPPTLPPSPATKPPSITMNPQPPQQTIVFTVTQLSNVTGGRSTDPEGPPKRDRERYTHGRPSVGLIAAFIASILLLTIVIGFSYLGSRHFKKKPQLRPKNGKKEDAEAARHRASSAYEADDENRYTALGIRGPPIYSSNYKSPNPDNAPHATKGDFGGKRAYASSSTPVQHNMHGHGGNKVSVPTLDAKDAVYKDPDLDNNLRGGHSGPVRLNQLVYNCVENLKAKKRSNRDPNSGLEQGPEYDYKDPDYKDPDYRDPDYKDPDYRDPDYKDPDLDPVLRDKNSGPVGINQLVYNCVEELKVAVAKGHRNDDVYDPGPEHYGLDRRSLNRSAKPSQNGTTSREGGSDEHYRNHSATPAKNGTTSRSGRVLSKRYFDRSSRASEYGSMSRDGHDDSLGKHHLDRVARPSKYGSMSSDKKPYTYTLEKYLPPPALYELEDYETMHSQVSSVLEQDEEEESERNGHTDDAVYGTTKF